MTDFPANSAEKPNYQLTFNSTFEGTSLDTQQWLPYYLPQWSSRTQSAARYALTGSTLQLQIEATQPAWCPEFDGQVRVSSLQTGCFSGPVGSTIGQHRFNPASIVTEEQSTARLYTPQYGFIETRLKAAPIPGYMVALWMIGFEEHPEQSGELCICEIFGESIAPQRSQIGYGIHPFGDSSLTDEFYQDDVSIDASHFHIYAAEWTPTYVDFFIDNQHIRRIDQSPSYAMQLMLGFYELPDRLTTASDVNTWPKSVEIDYVRGFRPNP